METLGFFDIAALVALLALVGAVSGVIAGLLGVGGGIVIVPALYYVFLTLDFPHESIMHVAVATSLATIVFTSVRSVLAHRRRGAVDGEVLMGWAPWIAGGAAAGAWLADSFDTDALMIVFGAIAFIVALNLAFPSENRVIGTAPPRGALRAGIAGATGFFSALMGIGGGTLGVPILMLYSQPVRRAVATAAGFGVLIAAPAVVGFILIGLDEPAKPPFTFGYVNLVAFAILTPLTVLCAPVGVRMAHSINTRLLTLIFAFFLAVTALNMLRKALYG